MTEEDPDILADDGDHDQSRSRSPFPAMSERFRLSEELANAKYQNNLLVQKCRNLEQRVESLNNEVAAKEIINSTLTSMFELLRKERDEARRLYCEEWAFTIELERGEASDPRDLAEEKKWDCYKGNTQ